MLRSICGRHIGNYSETEKAISGFAFNPCTGLQLSRQQVLIIEEVHVGGHWGQEDRVNWYVNMKVHLELPFICMIP